MLTRVEALNFRCLRYVSRPLDRFHVLVGPNGSGKTTFLDVVGFVSRLLNDGLEIAINEISPDPQDLLFGKTGDRFELAIEAELPNAVRKSIQHQASPSIPPTEFRFSHIRYEIAITVRSNTLPEIASERVAFVDQNASPKSQFSYHHSMPGETPTVLSSEHVIKTIASIDPIHKMFSFYPEVWADLESGSRSGLVPWFQMSKQKSALANVPEGENLFPATTWFKELLRMGTRSLSLVGDKIKRPSPPHYSKEFRTDGSNLPWVVSKLEGTPLFDDWMSLVQTALPDIQGIRTVIRDEDRNCYLKLKYENGIEIPQWMVSDGTLRLLALTLPAFSEESKGILLIEEPENGLHPRALETVFQALSYVPNTQVLLTTHSPQLLALAELPQILCFAKDSSGAVDIVSGDQHPTLKDWQHDISLGTLFAAGALE